MSRFTVTDLPLAGLKLIERQRLGDSRGFLSRLFCAQELTAAGWQKPIAQINHTHTTQRGTVRGMHYQQPPHAEMKLVTCIQGEVWDVAIDLRAGSPTFLHWHAELLSADNHHAMLIPEGFAHGFQTLSEHVALLYCHTAPHNSAAEAALSAQDPRLAIQWPIAITELSAKDANHPLIDAQFTGVSL
ncbi:dTDP-4-dehydrorhamnose 3,5-epimerase family protein [Rhodoferax sp. 4810]|nr:dTDP-4-dehydrorhamnose 3,5-epimerase family protein [Rhodoferax jenense]